MAQHAKRWGTIKSSLFFFVCKWVNPTHVQFEQHEGVENLVEAKSNLGDKVWSGVPQGFLNTNV